MTDSVLKRASVLGSVVSLALLSAALTPMSAHAAEGAVRVVCQAEGKELPAGSILVSGRVAAECPRADLFLPVGDHRIEVLRELPDGSFYRGGLTVTVRENAAQRVEVKAEKGFTEAYYHQKKDWAGLLKNYPDGQHADEARFRTLSNADYLARYPTGAFVEEARQKIAAAKAAEAKRVAEAKEREKTRAEEERRKLEEAKLAEQKKADEIKAADLLRKKSEEERNQYILSVIRKLDPDNDNIFKECPVCPEMVVIPAGSFFIGSPESEINRERDEGPQKQIQFPVPFAIGRYEVTTAEWKACVKESFCSGSEYMGESDRHPTGSSWQQAVVFTRWLSKKTGETYRLPTEAEWEYAARGGTQTPYITGYSIDSSQAAVKTRRKPVGQYKPNPFGLYDVIGNVAEWVLDCYYSSYNSVSPIGSEARSSSQCRRVNRGGSNSEGIIYLRTANRNEWNQSDTTDSIGLRVVREIK
ncbi:MAG: SUMF1/EgtB/PvdO family nonheme iron enzyme [Oligoflexus sp.]